MGPREVDLLLSKNHPGESCQDKSELVGMENNKLLLFHSMENKRTKTLKHVEGSTVLKYKLSRAKKERQKHRSSSSSFPLIPQISVQHGRH